MDFKNLDKIRTPYDWKNDILKTDINKRRPMIRSKLAVIISLYTVLTAFTITAVAAAPDFYEWLTEQLGNDVQIIEFNGYEITESGFFQKENSIYYLDDDKLVEIPEKTLLGSKNYNGKIYDFTFKYFLENDKIHISSKSENIIEVTAFNNDYAIIWLDLGKLWNSYFINLKTGVLKPIVDENRFSVSDGKLKLATDVKVSDNRNYLLYRSNRDASKTDMSKGEWFVQNIKTGVEFKLEEASEKLFSNEIGFIDDTHIFISFGETFRSMIFDCETNSYTDLGNIEGSEFGNSLIYYTNYENGNYIFYDLYADKIYKIKQSDTNRSVIVTREFICLLSSNGSADIYLIPQNKTISFKSDRLSGGMSVNDVKAIDEDTYLFITTETIYAINI